MLFTKELVYHKFKSFCNQRATYNKDLKIRKSKIVQTNTLYHMNSSKYRQLTLKRLKILEIPLTMQNHLICFVLIAVILFTSYIFNIFAQEDDSPFKLTITVDGQEYSFMVNSIEQTKDAFMRVAELNNLSLPSGVEVPVDVNNTIKSMINDDKNVLYNQTQLVSSIEGISQYPWKMFQHLEGNSTSVLLPFAYLQYGPSPESAIIM